MNLDLYCINRIEHLKIINLNTTTQASKFRMKNWVKINDRQHETYNRKNVKFKNTMLKSCLQD